MLRRLPALLLVSALALLTGCDVFYGFERTAQVPDTFEPTVAQEVLEQHPAYQPEWHVQAWDGKSMRLQFSRPQPRAWAAVSITSVEGLQLNMRSHAMNRMPSPVEIEGCAELQRELYELLLSAFPDLPPQEQLTERWFDSQWPF